MYDRFPGAWAAQSDALLEHRAARLEGLAADLRREAETLGDVLGGVRSRLTPAVWSGPAADRAVEAAAQRTSALRGAAGELQAVAQRLESDARALRERAAAVRAEQERERQRAAEGAAAASRQGG
jgi:PPE-repeat protein